MTDHWHMFLPTDTMKKRSLNPIFYTREGSPPFATLELNRSRWDPNYTQKGDAWREFQNAFLFLDSRGFWIPRCGFRITGTGFQFLSVELEFWVPIVSGIPDSLSCIPDSKVQDSRFHQQKLPDSEILIPLHGGISIFLSLLLILNNMSNSITVLTHILVPVCWYCRIKL